MSNLTEVQLETYVFIKGYLDATGTVPTMGTIGKKFGITTQGAWARFKQLIARGYIKAMPSMRQGYEVLK